MRIRPFSGEDCHYVKMISMCKGLACLGTRKKTETQGLLRRMFHPYDGDTLIRTGSLPEDGRRITVKHEDTVADMMKGS